MKHVSLLTHRALAPIYRHPFRVGVHHGPPSAGRKFPSMIKPSDLPPVASEPTDDRDAIERHIDKEILRHHAIGRPWPLTVASTRSGWSAVDIDAVLEKYRQDGWTVMSGGRRALCVIAPSTAVVDFDPSNLPPADVTR